MTFRDIPFIGRSEELQSLRRAVDPRVPAGHVAIVEAPAGTGKTRLVTEALASLEGSCTLISTRAQAFDQDLPFGAVEQLRRITSSVGPSGDVGGPQLVAEIVDAVRLLAEQSPVVIVAEDFQWADPGSWRAIRALAAEAAGRRLSVVVTIRSPFEGDGRAVLDRLAGSGALCVKLGDLSILEVQQLTRAFLGHEPTSEQSARIDRSAGNPLFLTEILRSLQHEDDQMLASQSAEPQTALPTTLPTNEQARSGANGEGGHPAHARVVLPSSLRAAVLSRLVGLGPRERQLLGIASLLGTNFSVDELAEIADRSILDVIEGLQIALRAGVILADRHELRFSHALVADCIREDQPLALRRSLHRHIAQVLARRGTSAQRIAEHYVLAFVGDDDAGGTDADAAMWLEKASKETQPTSLPTATKLLERAAKASPDERQRIRRTIDVAHLYLLGGRLAEAESSCSAILATPKSELEPGLELAARGILGAVYALRGPLHVGAAVAEFEAAIALAGPDGAAGHDESIVAESLAGKAMVLLYSGDAAQAVQYAEAAIASATVAGNRSARSRAEEALALAALTRLDVDGARAHAKESLAWFAPSNGPWAMLITPHLTASMVYVSLGDIEEAVAVCQAGLDVCSDSGHLLPRLYLLPCMAVFRLIQGNLEEANALASLTNDLIDDWCPSHRSAVTRAIVGYVAWLRGDAQFASQQVDRASQEMWDSGAQVAIADLVAWLIASVYEGTGRPDDAYSFMHIVWSIIGAATGAIVMAADLVRLAIPRDRSVAEQVVGELQRRADVAPTNRNKLVFRRSHALLYDDPKILGEVAEKFEAAGNLLTEAWTLNDLAELETRRAEAGVTSKEEAEQSIRHAIKRFDALGAPWASAELRAKARRIGVALRPSRTSGSSGLSEVEELVAGLAAGGLTNRQIGERLFISARTVETHLTHVFAKLGVKNRVQLSAHRSLR